MHRPIHTYTLSKKKTTTSYNHYLEISPFLFIIFSILLALHSYNYQKIYKFLFLAY